MKNDYGNTCEKNVFLFFIVFSVLMYVTAYI